MQGSDARVGGTESARAIAPLLRREVEALNLMACGFTDQAIAKKLACTERTVRRLFANAAATLGCSSRFQVGVKWGAIVLGGQLGLEVSAALDALGTS